MKKSDAIALFGTQTNLARALGISPQAVSQWPHLLTQGQIDRIIGAAIRLGKLPQLIAGRSAEAA